MFARETNDISATEAACAKAQGPERISSDEETTSMSVFTEPLAPARKAPGPTLQDMAESLSLPEFFNSKIKKRSRKSRLYSHTDFDL